MDQQTAYRIWDILVEECGAKPPEGAYSEREEFALYMATEDRWKEFRFMGKLGFGGKLKSFPSGVYVDCYPEHLNEERSLMIERANTRIGELLASRPGTPKAA
jgi:hypothetical protein